MSVPDHPDRTETHVFATHWALIYGSIHRAHLLRFVRDMYLTAPEIPQEGRLTRDQLELLGRALHVPLLEGSVRHGKLNDLEAQSEQLYSLRHMMAEAEHLDDMFERAHALEASISEGVQSLCPHDLFHEGLDHFKVNAAPLPQRLRDAYAANDITMFAQQLFLYFPMYQIWSQHNVPELLTYALTQGSELAKSPDKTHEGFEATLLRLLLRYNEKIQGDPHYAEEHPCPFPDLQAYLARDQATAQYPVTNITPHDILELTEALKHRARHSSAHSERLFERDQWGFFMVVQVEATYESFSMGAGRRPAQLTRSVVATIPDNTTSIFSHVGPIRLVLLDTGADSDDAAQDDDVMCTGESKASDHEEMPHPADNEEMPDATDNSQMAYAADNSQMTDAADNSQMANASDDDVVCTGESFDLINIDD